MKKDNVVKLLFFCGEIFGIFLCKETSHHVLNVVLLTWDIVFTILSLCLSGLWNVLTVVVKCTRSVYCIMKPYGLQGEPAISRSLSCISLHDWTWKLFYSFLFKPWMNLPWKYNLSPNRHFHACLSSCSLDKILKTCRRQDHHIKTGKSTVWWQQIDM